MRAIFVFLCLLTLIIISSQSLFDIHDLDWSTRPTDNFFMFVNGRWINRTTIPSHESEWGGLFTVKYENTYKLKRILDDLIRHDKTEPPFANGSIEHKLRDFYLAGLDEKAIEDAGLEPIKETLIQIQNIQTYKELVQFCLDWYIKMDSGLIFDFDVHADDRNSSINMVHWKQTGIQLPERDYYFRNDPISKDIRNHYTQYIDRLLTLSNEIIGTTTTLVDAEDIVSLELQLAVSHRTPYELRDAESNSQTYHINQLDQMMPNLNWHEVFSKLTIENRTTILAQPDYYLLLDKLLVRQPLSTWKNKIRFTILHELARFLTKDFVEAHFNMYDHLVYGQRTDKPRWTKLIEDIDRYLGDLLGQLYIARYFPYESKQRIMSLVENLIDAYQERIRKINWLNNSTKQQAIKKLRAINMKIAYSTTWKTYDDVVIDRSSYFRSLVSIFRHDYRKKMNDLRKPVDRSEWLVPAQIVNAFYYPPMNEIIFPAGILQEPFFSFFADDALNYGAIGYIIGHELTHSLDDQGRKYDEHGNLHHWWTTDDINEFHLRTEKLIRQYDEYRMLNTSINGRLTLGENMADLGGLEIAYQAFLRTDQAKENGLIDGFTPRERFFLSFARTWRVKLTNEKLLSSIRQDPHAPVHLRINGPLSNMMGFYETFNVVTGDGMFRNENERVLVW